MYIVNICNILLTFVPWGMLVCNNSMISSQHYMFCLRRTLHKRKNPRNLTPVKLYRYKVCASALRELGHEATLAHAHGEHFTYPAFQTHGYSGYAIRGNCACAKLEFPGAPTRLYVGILFIHTWIHTWTIYRTRVGDTLRRITSRKEWVFTDRSLCSNTYQHI